MVSGHIIALAAEAQCDQDVLAICTLAQPTYCWHDSCRIMEMVQCHPWLLLMDTRFSWEPEFYLKGVPGHASFSSTPMLKSAQPARSTASSSMLKTGPSRVRMLCQPLRCTTSLTHLALHNWRMASNIFVLKQPQPSLWERQCSPTVSTRTVLFVLPAVRPGFTLWQLKCIWCGTGVQLASGQQIPAALVVDATGGRSQVIAQFMKEKCGQTVETIKYDVGLNYHTRFFRVPDKVSSLLSSPTTPRCQNTGPQQQQTWYCSASALPEFPCCMTRSP